MLAWSTRLADVVPTLAGSAAADARVDDLLGHRAGLPAWGVLYRRDPWALGAPCSVPPEAALDAREAMVARAASRCGPPGAEVYSDIGYVLLGELLERATAQPLRSAWARYGCADARTRRAEDPRALARMPPTERLDWRGEVRGEVHDENAAMLERVGGAPGHAGAFGSALDVLGFSARFLRALEGEDPLLPPHLARAMIAPRAGGTHTLGWDLRSGATPSSGARFGPRTFGHLGFTGTSVWIDPDARTIAVLLTNRTWPTRHNPRIREARPRVHDAAFALAASRLSQAEPFEPSRAP
jgi:CubicO group peptidase (beta-lactamase class C family)